MILLLYNEGDYRQRDLILERMECGHVLSPETELFKMLKISL